MDAILVIAQLVFGIVVLTGGANVFVDGASGLARRFLVPPLVIGLTVVALGTSAPEIGVNVVAAISGQPALAIGNVLGSNILNILGVLGTAALVAPLVVRLQVVRLDVPVMVGSALLFWVFAWDGLISFPEAALLVIVLAIYTIVQITLARRARREEVAEANDSDEDMGPERPLPVQIAAVAGGALLLVIGSDLLVDGATWVARALEIDDRIIGLTVVAIGTSLPEFAASITATLKGERDMAVGNVLGSNIYNVLAVVGLTGCIAPAGIAVPPAALSLDFPVMLGASFICLPIFFVGTHIRRWEGASFVAYYLIYFGYLLVSASKDTVLTGASMGSWAPVLVGLIVIGSTAQWFRDSRRPRHDSAVGA